MVWMDIVVKFMICIIDVFLLYDFMSEFTDVRTELGKLHTILIGLATSLCILSVNMLENTYINLICVTVISWGYITVVFDLDLKRRWELFCIAYPIAAGCEILYPIMSPSTLYYIEKGETPPVVDNILIIIIEKLLNFIIFNIVKQVVAKPANRSNYKIFLTYLCLSISTFGIMVTIVYSGIDLSVNYTYKVAMTIFLILMILSNILILYVYTQYIEESEKNMDKNVMLIKKDAELQHLSQINHIYEEHQMLVHDVGNYLKVIEELVKSNKAERACDILEELNDRLGTSSLTEYSNHIIVNMLLSEKKEYAASMDVDFDVYIEPNVRMEEISDTDMIAMLGNLIDNAVHGASESIGDRKVRIRIFMQNNMQVLVIKVVNGFSSELILQDNRFVSTKKEEGIHGLGIRSVEKTAKQYGGYLECFIKEKQFHGILVLPLGKI